MKLSRLNLALIAALILQIVGIAAIALTRNVTPADASRGALLAAYDPQAVSELTIRDGNDKTNTALTLTKGADGVWTLPAFGGYPAETSKVMTILNAFKLLDTKRLIAQNQSSQTRLKVANDAYDRLVEFKAGGTTTRLFIGPSSEASAVYARLDGQQAVYLSNGLSSYEIGVNAKDWITTPYFSAPQDSITALKFQSATSVVELRKDGTTWSLVGLQPGEQYKADTINTLLSQLTSVALAAPIGTTADPKLGLDAPQVTITVQTRTTRPPTATPLPSATPIAAIAPAPVITTNPPTPNLTPVFDDKTITLQIGAKLENGDYALKSSDSKYYVRVSAAFAEAFTVLTRQSFLIVPPTPTAGPTVAATVLPTLAPATASAPTMAAPIVTASTVAATATVVLPTDTVVPPITTVPATTTAPTAAATIDPISAATATP